MNTGTSAVRPVLNVLRGNRADVPPLWLMRQAGRYLPEYRALRERKGSFLDLVYDPEAAAEVTLQPIRRFGFDAAILFSDILVIPHALGQDLRFLAGEGPKLSPALADVGLEILHRATERLKPVYETVKLVRSELQPEKALLGFAGSPWTVATYMVAGEGTKDQAPAKRLAALHPNRFEALLATISDLTIEYLSGQIAAGADAVQLFDSWSGSLSPEGFERHVIAPTRQIVQAIRERHPGVPVIGFAKGAGAKLARYAQLTGVDCVGLDETVDPKWADAALPNGLPVQGNLDPYALIAGGDRLERAIMNILADLSGRPHIFNLGHGILPDTPIAHVEQLVATVRQGGAI